MKEPVEKYSFAMVLLHWLSAVVVIGLFVSGIWMVDLDYYHAWYNRAPDWHQSVGILLMFATLIRLLVRMFGKKVASVKTHKKWEIVLGKLAHILLYASLFALLISGYLITTASGESIAVFSWFELAAIIEIEEGSDMAGLIHKIVAYGIIGLSVLHILAALKHHFIDKDETMSRILGRKVSK